MSFSTNTKLELELLLSWTEFNFLTIASSYSTWICWYYNMLIRNERKTFKEKKSLDKRYSMIVKINNVSNIIIIIKYYGAFRIQK